MNQLDKAGKLSDIAQFKEAIHNRESQSTTGIGEGIAIPHAKVAAVKSPPLLLVNLRKVWITKV